MSLRVWLPLNGDLHNQGASDLQFSYSGTNFSIDSNGKIGSCYKRTARAADAIISDKTINLGSHQSMFCWIKMDAFNSSSNLTGILGQHRHPTNTGMGITLKYKSATTGQLSVNTGTGSARTYVTYLGSTTLTTNTWYHVGYTYDGATIKLYVNGIEDGSHTFSGMSCPSEYIQIGNWAFNSSTLTTTTIANYCALGSINDVRIYDHCLSAAEVREIAQGLVLHYKLDQPTNINNNLYTGSQNFTGTWVNSSAWTTSTETYQNFTVKQRNATWGGLAQNIPCVQGDIFTISFWGKVDSGGNIQSVHRSNLGNVTTGLTILNGNFSSGTIWVNNSEDGTQWKRYWGTVQITGSDVTYLQWRLENSISGKNFYICGIKLEKGAAPSAWSFAASEAGETNIIYDSSGYNHNAVSNGSAAVALDSDTPKYSASTKFISGSRIAMPVASSTCLPTDAITVSIWYKSSAGTARFLSCTEGGGWNFEVNSSKASFPFYIKGKGYGRVIATQNFYSDNVWHMITASYDGVSTAKIYLDGQLDNTATITSGWENIPISYATSTPLTLGAEAQTIASPIAGTYVGNLSDLRIYCTALSDDAVLELYHTGAKVDNLGRFHSYELLENTGFKIHKTGVASHKLFIEPGYLNNITSVSYKPTANIDNSCVAGAIVDFTQFAQSELPLNIVAEYDVNWSNLTVGTGGNLAVTIQGNNREIASNSWKWSGTNYVTQGGITISAASGTTHVKKISTIPASWLNTYNGSHLGIRCNYSNGNGTISLTNIKVTVEQNKCKVKKEYIEADEFIEL